jgi:hypothetical protein
MPVFRLDWYTQVRKYNQTLFLIIFSGLSVSIKLEKKGFSTFICLDLIPHTSYLILQTSNFKNSNFILRTLYLVLLYLVVLTPCCTRPLSYVGKKITKKKWFFVAHFCVPIKNKKNLTFIAFFWFAFCVCVCVCFFW